jgi:cytidylate kinase
MIKVIAIDREYGSGGAEIAAKLAQRLGWKLWDQALTSEIAKLARCTPAEVGRHEERQDPLFHRLFKSFVRGSFEGNINTEPVEMLDTDRIVPLTEKLVKRAVDEGSCVIVGRGAPYYLHGRPDAFSVFIYAPPEEKVRRLKLLGKSREEALELIHSVDRDRAAFIKRYFGKTWPCRDHFRLMINSEMGDEAVVENILSGMSAVEHSQKTARAI